MLKYLRNKTMSVDRTAPDELTVFGVLDDDLYGVEMTAVFSQSALEILSITGKWHRYTTPECPRALDMLQPAVGMRLEPGFRAQVAKVIGRGACRHFANLLIEMGHAAKNAKMAIEYQEAAALDPGLSLEAFIAEWRPDQAPPKAAAQSIQVKAPAPLQPAPETPPLADAPRPSGGMVIDLHVHTAPASPCASAPIDEIIREAKELGVHGMVVTDHNYVWTADDIKRLRDKHDFLLLRGNEVITDQGDVLVYGLERDIKGVIRIADLRAEIIEAEGFMVMAHPFRGFLITGAEQMGLSVEQAAQREMFKHVDAIEVLNGKVTPDENGFAAKVADALSLPGTGGSDCHEMGTIGCYATEFTVNINSEADLVQALHAGSYRPVRFRD
ncbi:PHP domain protein [Desulfatibacillum aliphaticivorans]|uniref:PHP domain protein n=1 Tax=Desulfatibacillum aliphaticivorans TaxID=218208 RepID=B8FDC2_DESAL|nr:PHP-associated domain-containing protein [Desulfatibacillum aliphaticivorans]ACL06553.1 PHP domain protein [Desulfatibacillum aliphaticivorans]